MLPTTAAVRLVLIFDDLLATRANEEAVSVFIDPDCVYSHGQTVCRGAQQVKDGVGKRALLEDFFPDVIGFMRMDLFESKLHL